VPRLVVPSNASPRQLCAMARILPGTLTAISLDCLPGGDIPVRTAVKYYLIASGFPRDDVKNAWGFRALIEAFNGQKCVDVYASDAWSGHEQPTPIPQQKEPAMPDPYIPPPVRQPEPTPEPTPAPKATGSLDAIIAEIARGEIDRALANRPTLDEARIREIARDAANVTRVEIVLPGAGPETIPGSHHRQFQTLLRLTGLRMHVYLHGPAGSGKSTAAKNAALALKLPFGSTGKIDSKYDLLGFRDAHGRMVRTQLRESWEFGGLFLFDEFDRSDPSAGVALNNGLSTGALDFADCTVPKHPDCVIVAGGNTTMRGADRIYLAATSQDGSVADRFKFIDWQYDEDLESTLAGEDSGPWVSYVQRIRRSAATLKIDLIVSPRASIDGAKLLRAKFAQNEVEQMTIWRGLDPASVAKIKAAAGAQS